MNWFAARAFAAALCFGMISGGALAGSQNENNCLELPKLDNGKVRPADADYAIRECSAALKNATRTDRYVARMYMVRAEAWYAKKDYSKAIADAGAAIDADPKWGDNRVIRGDFYITAGQYDQAIKDYTGALALPSDMASPQAFHAAVYAKRAAAYGLMGRLDQAIADSNKAIALDPGLARAYYNLGLASKLQGNYAQALKDYQAAININLADPNNYIDRGVAWEKNTAAAKAADLYRNINFSIDMDTSGGIQVFSVQATRFGKALLVTTDDGLPASTIMLNGKVVFKGDDGMYFSMSGYFRTEAADVILIGSNAGGSGTPDSPLYFLVIRSPSQTEVLTDPDFVADTPDTDGLKKWMDKKGRIFVDLGYIGGDKKVAELDSGKLTVHIYSEKGKPLSDDLCQWVYEKGMESCKSQLAHEQGCEEYSNPAGVFSSHSDMTQLTYISNQPGYNQAGFNQSCLAWCNGKGVSYQQFSKTTCGAK
ncbi:MAG TPA: tetratricopeptide repeat protein [Gallionellaceae bacterium]|nr:tetratricopeptide repeat protein [Gallionellaceae bacterium]